MLIHQIGESVFAYGARKYAGFEPIPGFTSRIQVNSNKYGSMSNCLFNNCSNASFKKRTAESLNRSYKLCLVISTSCSSCNPESVTPESKISGIAHSA